MSVESFSSFFTNLLGKDFMPHGHCYFWRPEIVWLHVISDASIAISYYAIPFILLFFMAKRKDFPFPWVLAMFGTFILLCGTTHIMSIVTLWDPIYRLDGLIKAATAIISVLTTIMLIPLVPLALNLKSPKELEAANLKLADANEKLQEIDRLKDNFFSNISHELRTPLTLILSPLESFLANDYGTLSDVQRNNLQIMHNNSIRLYQMVNSILDFAKISSKKVEVKRESVDLTALTKSIVEEFSLIAKQKEIAIHFQCEAHEKWVSMDRYLYERILFNLLSNAVKFTSNHGSISITLRVENEKAILKVSDTGIGISEENQKKLFQRFQQVEGSATRRFEGTGLGLSLVKEFSILLGGDVQLQSQLNQGSTFTVKINAPLAVHTETKHTPLLSGRIQKYNTALPAQHQLVSVKTAGAAAPRILVAEDNLELATYIISLLSEFAEVKHVDNGEAALKLVKTYEPDLVMLDVMMPIQDGISVCRDIKSNSKTMHIPVVLLTALTHRDALTRGWEAGADEYLFKPFHPKELVTRIKLLLSHADSKKVMQELNRELITAARFAGRAEVVSSVLHNVGNAINSVNVAVHILLEKLNASKIKELINLKKWIEKSFNDPSELFNNKKKQEQLISYFNELNDVLVKEQNVYVKEIDEVCRSIKMINQILAHQNELSAPTGIVEKVNIAELMDNALLTALAECSDIHVTKQYSDLKAVLDKTRLNQILVNLIHNAKEALLESQQPKKQLTITIKTKLEKDSEWLHIDVQDNGSGIEKENLIKIFSFGFTTKTHSQSGFGLHLSALSAKEMGGSLTASSAGKNQGATFSLVLPMQPVNIENWIEVS